MSNVVSLNAPRRTSAENRNAALIDCFAQCRRSHDDVFWLKENAELLGILETTGAGLSDGALIGFEGFYAQIEKRLRFFPQYYRFLLSICLDLEDLGMAGGKGEALCRWAATEGLPEAELSDLQRAEACRLMGRRDVEALPSDPGLTERLHRFIDRSSTFVVPNKKAAYELTHIVFYLSEYGRKDPRLSPAAITSLEFAGLLAFLDQNNDLLAEICVALRFGGVIPSEIWERSVLDARASFRLTARPGADLRDGYHEYFVTSWAASIMGQGGFRAEVPDGCVTFTRTQPPRGALRSLSECMFELDEARLGDWSRMRPHVQAYLGEDGTDIVTHAEQSSDKFDAFFEGFARAGHE